MRTDEIQHLAGLARIAVTDEEALALATEFDAILGYVAQVTDVSGDATHSAPLAGVHRNVMRDDIETHVPGAYTTALLNAVPKREGEYVHVKKVFKDK